MLAPIIVFCINLVRRVRNGWRTMLRRRVDYVIITLNGALPEFTAPVTWWRKRLLGASAPLSMSQLRRQFQRIGDDPHTQGVLLKLDGLAIGSATMISLRSEIKAFRKRGKRVVAYTTALNRAVYSVACAADEIIAPVSIQFDVLGLYYEGQYLGDALARYGLRAEIEAVSPYKSAYESFARGDMSPENREQLERLIDGSYQRLVSLIAADRNLSEATVRTLIDGAPFSATEAQANGLVDHVLYEDELAAHLHQEPGARSQKPEEPVIVPWAAAQKRLLLPLAKRHRQFVGVVAVEGAIVRGASSSLPLPIPLIGGPQAGSDAVTQALRAAEQNKRIAALILYVDSPGGDALASDLIGREVQRVQRQKPVVVVMGNVAASGGYYIATPAAQIIASEATVTGSIGVISLRVALDGLLDRFDVHTVAIRRGEHSGLAGGFAPLTEGERAAWRRSILTIYDLFKQRVREGRGISAEALEPIAGGRVWTGDDALRHGLIDELGDIRLGLRKAQELAKLPIDDRAPLVLLRGGRGQLAPQPFPTPIDSFGALLAAVEAGMKPRVLALLPWVGLDEL